MSRDGFARVQSRTASGSAAIAWSHFRRKLGRNDGARSIRANPHLDASGGTSDRSHVSKTQTSLRSFCARTAINLASTSYPRPTHRSQRSASSRRCPWRILRHTPRRASTVRSPSARRGTGVSLVWFEHDRDCQSRRIHTPPDQSCRIRATRRSAAYPSDHQIGSSPFTVRPEDSSPCPGSQCSATPLI